MVAYLDQVYHIKHENWTFIRAIQYQKEALSSRTSGKRFKPDERIVTIAFHRSMTHDPNIYRSPNVFDPSRFLPTNGTSSIPDVEIIGRGEPRLGSIPFGFGRRSDIHLAQTLP